MNINNAAGVSLLSAVNQKGTLNLNNGVLTTYSYLKIDIDAGGNIGYATGDVGSVSGSVTVFRAVPTGTTHYISSPVNSATVADLTDDSEVINPLNGNTRLFHFDNNTHAWVADKNLTTVLSPSNSYSLWFPVPTSLDFTGSYTHAAAYSYSGTNTPGKFLFISNPYPSTIDWDAVSGWNKTNVDNAIYFWTPDGNKYTTYINGVGLNGGSRYIPAMNAFFIAFSGTGGPTATVAMDNRVRSTQLTALWRTASDETIRLKLIGSTESDETVVRFNELATTDYDREFDAYKMMNSSTIPSIYTISKGTRYAVNSIANAYSQDTIPVIIKVPADGKYILSITNSDPTVEYMLVDKQLGTKTPVTTMDYSFSALKTDAAERFELQRTSITTDVQQASALSALQILSSPNGFLVKSTLAGPGIIEVLDLTGNRVKVLSDVSLTNGNNFFTPGLSEGAYVVKITMGNMSYVGQISILK